MTVLTFKTVIYEAVKKYILTKSLGIISKYKDLWSNTVRNRPVKHQGTLNVNIQRESGFEITLLANHNKPSAYVFIFPMSCLFW